MEKTSEVLWSDRKRPVFGLPISFTKYTLFEEKLYITVKFLSMHEEEIRLFIEAAYILGEYSYAETFLRYAKQLDEQLYKNRQKSKYLNRYNIEQDFI